MADVRSQVDWSKRSAELGPLEEVATPDGPLVAMPLRTPGIEDPDLDWGLRTTWLDLPRHPRMFEAVGQRDGALLLRYAAIDWTWRPGSIASERTVRQAATWGIELTRMFDFAAACLPAEQLGWLACPFVRIDIVGDLKVGFFNPAGSKALMRRVAPEVLATFPAADARALVFAIGQLMLHLVELAGKASETPLGQVIMRCLAPRPQDRFATLAQLRDALEIVGGRRRSMSPYEDADAWELAQQAIGYALLGNAPRAASLLRQVKGVSRRFDDVGFATAFGVDLSKPAVDIADYEERIRLAQAARKGSEAPAAALEMVMEAQGPARPATADLPPEKLLASAERHLLAREYGPAIDLAQQALARDPKAVAAYGVLAEGRLRRREFAQALEAVQQWTLAKPDEGHAHYVAAKVLLALGRLAEARDACDRAIELAPSHLPAMMLRRQIERSVRRVASQTGTSRPAPGDLPAHLRELRPLLLAGKTAEVIARLEKPEFAADDAARLLRADLLAFSEQLEAALGVYEAIGGLAAGVGRTLVLVKLGRAAEALALCDLLVKQHPSNAEAHEARALALQQLGRGDEAGEELRRAAVADRHRAPMRTR